jgi:hypothetical protein
MCSALAHVCFVPKADINRHSLKTQGGVIPGSRLFAMLQHISQNISAPETENATAQKYARGPSSLSIAQAPPSPLSSAPMRRCWLLARVAAKVGCSFTAFSAHAADWS